MAPDSSDCFARSQQHVGLVPVGSKKLMQTGEDEDAVQMPAPSQELQRRSSKVLEKRSLWS